MIRINLAPPAARDTRSGLARLNDVHLGLLFGGAAMLVALATGAYWWTASADVARLHREIEQGERDKTRLQALVAEGRRLKSEADDLQRRVDAIEALARLQARPAALMGAMAPVVPADVWLTRVEEKARLLRVAGRSHTQAGLSQLMANLKTSGSFADVDLVESRQDLTTSPRTIAFEVSCRFEAPR